MTARQMSVAVMGAGPAGLFAAETLAAHGASVTVFDAMPSPARKFLLAGRGGLNLTHSEPLETFLARYDESHPLLFRAVRDFPPDALTAWANDLGIATFAGSSGRIFPVAMKASPLVRAWLARLDRLGVKARFDARWLGFDTPSGEVKDLATPSRATRIRRRDGQIETQAFDAVVLALGGASWPRMGSTGAWSETLTAGGIPLAPFVPANCGVVVDWSDHFRDRFEGVPLKRIAVRVSGPEGERAVTGEAVVTRTGLEGGALYAIGAPLRRALNPAQRARLHIDLKPDQSTDILADRLAKPRGRASLSTHLRKAVGLPPVAIALLREAQRELDPAPDALARLIKCVAIDITGLAGLERAISTAGGVRFEALDEGWMVKDWPGVFVAGEMADWSAPTGGYLLQGCFASARAAAMGALKWLARDAG